MSSLQVVFLAVVLLVGLAQGGRVPRAGDDKYTSKYDNVNIDEVLASDRLLQTYTKCLLDTGKCTPDGTELKSHISDALISDCAKCRPNQRQAAEKVINFLIKNKNATWKELEAKYDPTGIYQKKYETNLKKIETADA